MPTVFGQGNSAIKSIQRGTTTVANGSTSNTATITAVDMDKSLLLMNDSRVTNVEPVKGVLTNSTTLTFDRAGSSGAVTVAWQVIEFN